MKETTLRHVIPWIGRSTELAEKRMLEIGCGEGGNLVPFEEAGCIVTGVDRNPKRIDQAKEYINEFNADSKIELLTAEAMALDSTSFGQFDLIILKDFIEHIDQEPFLAKLKSLLKPNGLVFIGFPPWQMPYGGHQQVCSNRFSKLPWIHLMPRVLYLNYLRWMGEPEPVVLNMAENIDTGLSIESLKSKLKQAGFRISDEEFYLINPGYEVKFNLRPRKQLPILRSIPWLRNFYTTCYYCLVELDSER